MAEKQRILIVDDDYNIAELISLYLTKECFETKIVGDGEEALRVFPEFQPNLILLDLMLPDADGLDIVRELRQDKRGRELPIILVTARTTEIDKVKGLDIGADDYLTKPFGIMELIARMKALLRRTSREQNSRVLEIGTVRMDDEKHKVTAAGADCELTFKEYELLKLLMTNAGIVTSREEILEKVWGTNFEGESRTLDMHIKTLRQKLGETGSLIKTVRNVGYIFSA